MNYKVGDKVVILDGMRNSLNPEDTGKIVTIKKVPELESDKVYFLASELKDGFSPDGRLYFAYKKYIRLLTKLEKAMQ